MEQIALIVGNTVFYWKPLLLIAGTLSAILLFLGLYLRKPRRGLAAAFAVPVALILSILLARLIHWYCRTDSYTSLQAALTDHSTGGYALMGVFAGCIITALVLRLVRISDSAPAMLDCMALAGSAGITVGRLTSFFDSSNRGLLMETVQELPWAYPVVNPVSGATEFRLATFLIQAMIAGGLFVILLLPYLVLNHKRKMRDGDTAMLFLLIYCASQVVLDSTRYDALAFRSNGFVSVVQVFAAITMGVVIVIFSLRLVKLRGMKLWYLGFWAPIVAALGVAGYMEYYVQRHGSKALFSYSIMSLCLILIILIVIVMNILTPSPKENTYHGRFLKEQPSHSPEDAPETAEKGEPT